jgi:hypothetical protein
MRYSAGSMVQKKNRKAQRHSFKNEMIDGDADEIIWGVGNGF